MSLTSFIRVRTLKRLHQYFNIPLARKFTLPQEEATQLVVDQVAEDINLTHGPAKIMTKIALSNQVIMPQYIVMFNMSSYNSRYIILVRLLAKSCMLNGMKGLPFVFLGPKAKKLQCAWTTTCCGALA